MSRNRLVKLNVSPEFRKKMIKEAKIVRGISVAEYSRQLAATDTDMKQLINKKDEKLEEKKVKRGFNFGI